MVSSRRAAGRAPPRGAGRGGPSSIVAARHVRSTPRAPRAATASTRSRQSPSSAWWGLARATTTAGAVGQVTAQLLGAGDHVLAVGELAREQVGQEVGHRRLAGPLGRLGTVDLLGDEVVTMRSSTGGGRRGAGAQPQLADAARRPPAGRSPRWRPRPPAPRARPRATGRPRPACSSRRPARPRWPPGRAPPPAPRRAARHRTRPPRRPRRRRPGPGSGSRPLASWRGGHGPSLRSADAPLTAVRRICRRTRRSRGPAPRRRRPACPGCTA